MLSPLTQIAITLLHDIAMHEPHEAIGHCTSPEEVQIKVRALLKDNTTVIEREVENIEANEEADGSGVTTLHIEADITEPLPDVTISEDSGFNANVDEWGQENDTEIPI